MNVEQHASLSPASVSPTLESGEPDELPDLGAPRTPRRVRDAAIVVGIVVVCSLTRLPGLLSPSIWYDETFSRALACEMTWGEMFASLRADVHPPFYFAMLRLWSGVFGDDIASLRMFSVVMSGLTAAGLFLFTRRLSDSRGPAAAEGGSPPTLRGDVLGLSAAGLYIAGAPFVIESQQAKAYALGTALCALSSWALLRLLPLQAKPVWSRIISYGLLAGGMALTHPYGIFTLAAQLLFLGAVSVQAFVSSPQSARPQIRIPVAAAAIPIAAYCLWLPIVLEQMARVRYDYWIPPFRWDTISTSMAMLLFPTLPHHPSVQAIGLLIVGASAVMSIVVLASRERGRMILLLSLIWVPLVLTFVVSSVLASVCTPRYLLFVAMFLPVLTVVALHACLPDPIAFTVVALAGVNQAIYTAGHQQDRQLAERGGSRAVVDALREVRMPDEPVIVRHPAVYFNIKYYAGEAFDPFLLLPPEGLPHYIGGPLLRKAQTITPTRLAELDADSIWVVDTSGFAMIQTAAVADNWKMVADTAIVHREAFDWQGQTFASRYAR